MGNHPQYGRQLSVTRYQSAAPGTLAALRRYLGSGLLKGVGPVLAQHIANTFGLETMNVLDNHPERLQEVPGMGARKALAIAEAWRERRALKEIMVYLQAEGLPVALAVRILRKYGSAAEGVVREQPYRLAAEVYGVSFEVADAIAARSGVVADAPQRVGAGVAAVFAGGCGKRACVPATRHCFRGLPNAPLALACHRGGITQAGGSWLFPNGRDACERARATASGLSDRNARK